MRQAISPQQLLLNIKYGHNTEKSTPKQVGVELVKHFYRTFTRGATKDKVGFPDYLTNFS